jgi:hypothetical protein
MSFPWCLASQTKTTRHFPSWSFTSIIPPSGLIFDFSRNKVTPNRVSTAFNFSLISFFSMLFLKRNSRLGKSFFKVSKTTFEKLFTDLSCFCAFSPNISFGP